MLCACQDGVCNGKMDKATKTVGAETHAYSKTSSNTSIHESDDDDIWGDDEPTQTPAAKRIHTKQGYVDGLAHAQESSLQAGFDEGYGTGAGLGVAVGSILAKTWGTPAYDEARRELVITNVLSRQWFDNDLCMKKHALIQKWNQNLD